MAIDLKLTAPQLTALRSLQPGRTVFLGWGRGTGKSKFLRTACWLLVAQHGRKVRTSLAETFRGVRIAWLMPHRKQFVDVHGTAILDELGPGGRFAFLGAKINRTTWQIDFAGGSTLLPFPAADATSQNARGIRADMIVVDECDDINAEVYDAIAVPWLSAAWSMRQELIAGTPTRGRHGLWYRTLAQGRRAQQLRDGSTATEDEDAEALRSIHAIHATYRDCPEIISDQAVRKARATMPRATFDREYEANPDAGEGLVYPFEESFHVREPAAGLRFREEFVCVDHGYNDPGVMLRVGVLGHGDDAIAWIVGEQYEREKPNGWWNDRAREHVSQGRNVFFCDPSRPDRIADLCNLGAQAIGADNGIAAGIARVANMLFVSTDDEGTRRARLFVSPTCVNTIREFGLYRRKKAADGSFLEDVEDKNNHCLDALRYGLVMRFGRFERGGRYVGSAR